MFINFLMNYYLYTNFGKKILEKKILEKYILLNFGKKIFNKKYVL